MLLGNKVNATPRTQKRSGTNANEKRWFNSIFSGIAFRPALFLLADGGHQVPQRDILGPGVFLFDRADELIEIELKIVDIEPSLTEAGAFFSRP